jgi:beta-xylosidase
MSKNILFLATLFFITITGNAQKSRSGNPIFPGWYADPEAAVFGKTFWIFPTYSAPFEQQVFMDAFSSADLQHWEKHPRIIDTAAVKWAKKAMWAPAIVQKDSLHYLFFSANDVHPGELGGIGVAVAEQPAGPYRDLLGKPLINDIHNGAQPIDQFVFQDKDGKWYMIYGGWQHCNIVQLKPDFTGLLPFADGSTYKEITPADYVEGPMMFLRRNKYYFMWSEGGWGGPHYRVAYGIADSPFGPFNRIGTVLQQDSLVATGAGHHSVIQVPEKNKWFIVYHRRPLGETDPNHRVVCIDEMRFDKKGFIRPITITKAGVKKVKP